MIKSRFGDPLEWPPRPRPAPPGTRRQGPGVECQAPGAPHRAPLGVPVAHERRNGAQWATARPPSRRRSSTAASSASRNARLFAPPTTPSISDRRTSASSSDARCGSCCVAREAIGERVGCAALRCGRTRGVPGTTPRAQAWRRVRHASAAAPSPGRIGPCAWRRLPAASGAARPGGAGGGSDRHVELHCADLRASTPRRRRRRRAPLRAGRARSRARTSPDALCPRDAHVRAAHVELDRGVAGGGIENEIVEQRLACRGARGEDALVVDRLSRAGCRRAGSDDERGPRAGSRRRAAARGQTSNRLLRMLATAMLSTSPCAAAAVERT